MNNKISIIPFVIIAIYFITILYLGLKPQKERKATFEDFYTGSKSMSGLVVGLVMLVTFYSGSTWTGWQGFVASYGVFGAYVIPYCVFSGVILYFLAGKIWPLGKKYNLSTLADLIELRFQSKPLKVIVGLIGGSMNLTWITMEIITIGYVINIATQGAVSVQLGALIGITVLTIYTLWGGVKSVATVNTIQSSVMLIGSIFIALYLAFAYYGSLTNMFEQAFAVNPLLLTLPGPDNAGSWASWISFALLCTLGAMCWPSLYLKIYMGKGINEIRKTGIFTAIAGVWCVFFIITGFAAAGITSMGQAGFTDPQGSLLEMTFRTGNMIIFGFTCTFIIAAAMGTVDGTLLAISGIFSNDVISTFVDIKNGVPNIGQTKKSERKGLDEKTKVLLTRIIILFIAISAYIVSRMNLPMLVFIAMYNYQGIAQFFPILVGVIGWKKCTKQGAYAGLLTGTLTFIIMALLKVSPLGFLPGVWGVVLNALTFIVVSKLTYKDTKDENMKLILDDFYGKGKLKQVS